MIGFLVVVVNIYGVHFDLGFGKVHCWLPHGFVNLACWCLGIFFYWWYGRTSY